MHVAEEDETPKQIAQKRGVELRDVLEANAGRYARLTANARLKNGTTILIPQNNQLQVVEAHAEPVFECEKGCGFENKDISVVEAHERTCAFVASSNGNQEEEYVPGDEFLQRNDGKTGFVGVIQATGHYGNYGAGPPRFYATCKGVYLGCRRGSAIAAARARRDYIEGRWVIENPRPRYPAQQKKRDIVKHIEQRNQQQNEWQVEPLVEPPSSSESDADEMPYC